MKLRATYLKGSSIVEVLVALAITSFCVSLAAIIYLNIQRTSLPFFKIKAMELAENYLAETMKEKSYYDDTKKGEEFLLKKAVLSHPLFEDCYLLRILVFDASKKEICELEMTVHKKN